MDCYNKLISATIEQKEMLPFDEKEERVFCFYSLMKTELGHVKILCGNLVNSVIGCGSN